MLSFPALGRVPCYRNGRITERIEAPALVDTAEEELGRARPRNGTMTEVTLTQTLQVAFRLQRGKV